ncbi:helicase [Microbacterium ulmi]|uniref:Helicase n=1 Tax=Microbacterium ulmi TaxID=179095 RepID=A0A7Y2Q1I9_9MICO|nr:helicase [Microbacterium ulmi]NII68551.1 hypothetical protein [Microbacterium ulmi]NNH05423.1 helicase [Microbacterium ulmi]
MPGTALAVGVVACTAALAVGLCSMAGAAAFGQRLAATADAAVLAAADAASGAVDGVPCERAAELAATGDAVVADCRVDGLVATVTVSARFGVLVVSASARAGPPPAAE